jgi:hypothetical protein
MYLSVLCLRPSWSAADARAGAVPTRTRAARPPRAAHPEPARRQRGVHQWICATPRATHSALRRRPRDRRTGGRIYHHLARRADGAAFVGPVPPLLVHGIRGLSAGSPRNAVLHTARYTLRATHCAHAATYAATHCAHAATHCALHTARTLLHTALALLHTLLRTRCYTLRSPCYTLRTRCYTRCAHAAHTLLHTLLHTAHTLLHTLLHTARTLLHTCATTLPTDSHMGSAVRLPLRLGEVQAQQ